MRLPIDSLIIAALAVAWLSMQPGPEAGIALIASISALIYRWRKNKTEGIYDFTYPTEDALKFYSAIAEGYDSRNSPSLQKSHLCTLEKIESFLENKNNWSVLDLGAGTGKLIALRFFNNPNSTWVVVDGSPAMMGEFSKNLSASKLKIKTSIEEIESYLDRSENEKHDVVLVSYLLTSMPKNPDWLKLVRKVKDDGRLIIVDAEPSYTALHQHYSVSINNKTHALKTRPVSGTTLIEEIDKVGFTMESAATIKNGENPYAYIYVFKKKHT